MVDRCFERLKEFVRLPMSMNDFRGILYMIFLMNYDSAKSVTNYDCARVLRVMQDWTLRLSKTYCLGKVSCYVYQG